MARVEDDFLNRKLEHILRDYDRGWAAGLARRDRITRIRTWHVTVFTAYLAFIATRDPGEVDITVLPLAGATFLFWVMEALATALGIFHMETTVWRIDRIFSEAMADEFQYAIKQYRFHSEKNRGKRFGGKGGRWHRFALGFLNLQPLVFYGLPFSGLLLYELMNRFPHYRISDMLRNWIEALPLFALCFVLVITLLMWVSILLHKDWQKTKENWMRVRKKV